MKNFCLSMFFPFFFFSLSWVGGGFKETTLFKRRGLTDIPAAPTKGLGHKAVKRGRNSTLQYTRLISSV